jgi:hypothetical protein
MVDKEASWRAGGNGLGGLWEQRWFIRSCWSESYCTGTGQYQVPVGYLGQSTPMAAEHYERGGKPEIWTTQHHTPNATPYLKNEFPPTTIRSEPTTRSLVQEETAAMANGCQSMETTNARAQNGL